MVWTALVRYNFVFLFLVAICTYMNSGGGDNCLVSFFSSAPILTVPLRHILHRNFLGFSPPPPRIEFTLFPSHPPRIEFTPSRTNACFRTTRWRSGRSQRSVPMTTMSTTSSARLWWGGGALRHFTPNSPIHIPLLLSFYTTIHVDSHFHAIYTLFTGMDLMSVPHTTFTQFYATFTQCSRNFTQF